MTDLRYALRQLLKSPGFTALTLLTLALGIGATTAILAVVHAVLLKPLDYPAPGQLVVLRETTRDHLAGSAVCPADFLDWTKRSTVFSSLAAIRGASVNLTGGDGEPARLAGARVTSGYFSTYGVSPILGRSFSAAEDQPGGDRVAVISHGLWVRHFNAAPSAIGRTLQLDGHTVSVIGVMPPRFQRASRIELWLPMAFTDKERTERGAFFINSIGRLKPGITLPQAQSEITLINEQLEQEFPDTNRDIVGRVDTLLNTIVGAQRPALLTLLAAVGALLLIACVNVANLLLARATGRLREVSVRAALGASPLRIIRQLLTESVLLASIGGALGVLFALWGIDALVALAPKDLPRIADVALDPRVLLASTAIILVCGIGFGLAPALQCARLNLVETLKDGSRGSGESGHRGRFRSTLVVTEVALALSLLVAASLLMRSFTRLITTSPGFDPVNATTLAVALPPAIYDTAGKQQLFADAVLARIAGLPGVAGVGAVQSLPFSGSEWVFGIEVEGRPAVSQADMPEATYYAATPGYLEAARVPVVRGRTFTPQDAADAARVAIVSQTFANRILPGEDPIGKRINITNNETQAWREIVGIVGDVKQNSLDEESAAAVYEPFAQHPYRSLSFVVRTHGPVPELARQLKQAVHAVNPQQPVFRISPLSELIATSAAQQRFATTLLATFSALALLLASIGIYGVMAYNVSQRTAEYGVRLALGAQPADVLRLVLGRAGRLIGAGLLIGAVLAAIGGHTLASQLYGVSPYDPLIYLAVAACFGAIALLACWFPARRATRVDPLTALRAE